MQQMSHTIRSGCLTPSLVQSRPAPTLIISGSPKSPLFPSRDPGMAASETAGRIMGRDNYLHPNSPFAHKAPSPAPLNKIVVRPSDDDSARH